MDSNSVVTRIAITPHEWAETRKAAIDAGLTAPHYIALAVRRQLVVAAKSRERRKAQGDTTK